MGMDCCAGGSTQQFRGWIMFPASQLCNNGAGQNVTWSSAFVDTDGFFDPTTPDRIKLVLPGKYLLVARATFSGGTVGEIDLFITDPGTTANYGRESRSAGPNIAIRLNNLTCSGIMVAPALNSPVAVELYQNSGANYFVGVYFQGQWLGP